MLFARSGALRGAASVLLLWAADALLPTIAVPWTTLALLALALAALDLLRPPRRRRN